MPAPFACPTCSKVYTDNENVSAIFKFLMCQPCLDAGHDSTVCTDCEASKENGNTLCPAHIGAELDKQYEDAMDRDRALEEENRAEHEDSFAVLK